MLRHTQMEAGAGQWAQPLEGDICVVIDIRDWVLFRGVWSGLSRRYWQFAHRATFVSIADVRVCPCDGQE